MISKAQRRANRHWRKIHPKEQRLYSDHSAAKRYVKRSRNIGHLKQLMLMIKERIKEL